MNTLETRIWTARFDVATFASSYLVDELGDPIDFLVDWPDFEGQPLKDVWKTPKIKIKDNKPTANFTDIDPGILICDSFSRMKLESFLKGEIEVLPVESVNAVDMYVLNVVNVIDCLDVESSDIDYFEDSSDIMEIKKYIFYLEKLKGIALFKIPQFSRTEIFATDIFREKILEDSLTGLQFSQVF